jgi:O-antigen ligase
MNFIKNLRLEISQKNIYQNTIFFSLALAPIGFAAGPLVMEILIFAANLSFAFLIAKKKINFYFNKKIVFFLILYLTIILISSIFSNSPITSLKSGVLSFRFVFFILAGIYLLNNFKSSCKYLFYAYFFIILFFIIDAYVQFFLGKDFFLIEPIDKTRITGVFGDEKKLGSFLIRLIPLLLGLSTILFKNKTTLIFSLIILFVLPVLILTRERITLVFILITLIFLTVYSWNTIALNIKSYILLLCLMVSIPVIFYNFKIANFNKRVTDTIIQLKGGEENGELKFWSIQHQAFGQTAIEIFKKRKLFGSGIKTYRYNCKEIKIDYKNNCSTHPHNIFFQLLSETGLAGITLYLFFLFLIIKELFLFLFFKNRRNPSIFFLLSFFFYFNPIFPSGQFFNNWYMGIGTFPLIFYFYFRINRKFNMAR